MQFIILLFLLFFHKNQFNTPMQNQEKDKHGRPMPNYAKYPSPVIAVDAIVIRPNKDDQEPEILLCTRGSSTFKGCLVFPGGHVDYCEAPETAVIRELKEETGLDATLGELITVKGDPLRDPRKHVVSIVYSVTVPGDQIPKGGDDAADAKFYKLKDVLQQKEKFGFDHFEILQEAIKKLNISI